jgi:hypothetical protein
MAPGEKLIEAGLLLPHRVRDEAGDRLAAMKEDLIALLNEYQPAAIVIEWTSGKVIGSRHAGGGAGLPIYGVAVGTLWQVCEYWAQARTAAGHPCRVVRIAENEWTQGRPKLRRRIGGQPALSRVDLIQHRFPRYVPEKDPGGDVADAIGLNVYYQRKQKVLGLGNARPA